MPSSNNTGQGKRKINTTSIVERDAAQIVAGRMPPQNIEAEISTLGALLLDAEAINKVSDFLKPEDFYRPEHEEIFRAMLILSEKRIPIDLVTVSEELLKRELLDQVGGQAKLASLVAAVATASNVAHYGRIVQDKAMLRRLIHAAGHISELGFETELDSESVMDQAEQTLFDVTQRALRQNFVAVSSILADSFERLDALSRQKGSMRGIGTGFRQVDGILGGLQRSDLVIVAARPSMGKTAWCLNIAQNVALDQKKTVGIFSLEMNKEQLVDRLVSSIGTIDSWKLRNGQLSDQDYRNLNEAYGKLADCKVFIDDAAGMSIMEVRAKARRLQAEHGLDLIIIDYLQLMRGSSTMGDNRVQEVSEISRSLKALAKELNVPVVALSQLSRAVESRPDKRPLLSDLRESGCLAGDTLITRADTGERIAIKDLVRETEIPVYSLDNNKLIIRNINKVFSSGFKQLFELNFRSGRKIKASANHKFKTYDGWIRVDEMKPGLRLALSRKVEINTEDNADYSDQMLIFLGHMIGDGCFVEGQPVHYTSNDMENIKAVAHAAREEFGISSRVISQSRWYHLYLPSPYRCARGKKHPFREWLEKNGLNLSHSFNKVLPSSLYTCSNRQIALLLKHLWATDGCIHVDSTNNYSIYYATTSERLAEQVQHLLLRFGIQSTSRMVRQVKNGKEYRSSFRVDIQGKTNQLLFLQNIGCYGTRGGRIEEIINDLNEVNANPNNDVFDKSIWQSMIIPAQKRAGLSWRMIQKEMGNSYCGTTLFKSGLSRDRLKLVASVLDSDVLTSLAESDLYWDELVQIMPLEVEEVFDATVPGTHNFLANDIVVHNSIEQDADVVIFLYRDDYYNKDEKNNIMEILVRKHRNGPTGDAKVMAKLQYSRFEDIDSRHMQS